jgi:hypothetical protein
MFIFLRQLMCHRSPLSTAETRRCVRLAPEVVPLGRATYLNASNPIDFGTEPALPKLPPIKWRICAAKAHLWSG